MNILSLHWGFILATFGAGSGLLALVWALHVQRRGDQAMLSLAGWVMVLMGGSGCVALLPTFSPAAPPASSVPAIVESYVGAPPTLLPAATPIVAPLTPVSNLAPTAVLAPEPPAVTEPARLQITSLNLEAPITVVPIRDGVWDLDRLGAQVGWLTSTGAYPEDKWAMVLVGHITLTTLERGAFADLEKIKYGAIVTYRVNGIEYVYEVREKGRVAPADVEALYVPDGKVLLLMTCTDYNSLDRTYANRLLIRAELIEKRAVTP